MSVLVVILSGARSAQSKAPPICFCLFVIRISFFSLPLFVLNRFHRCQSVLGFSFSAFTPSLSVSSINSASSAAISGFIAPASYRQPQFPIRFAGVFIRASLPSRRMSCIGKMHSRATDRAAARIIAPTISSSFSIGCR